MPGTQSQRVFAALRGCPRAAGWPPSPVLLFATPPCGCQPTLFRSPHCGRACDRHAAVPCTLYTHSARAKQKHTRLSCTVAGSVRGFALNVSTAAGFVGPVCPAGRYLDAAGACSNCEAGRWGVIRQVGPCEQLCEKGYACRAGSSSPTESICPAGRYSDVGAGECTPCAAGRWSASVARTSPCQKSCEAGYMCPVGSANSTTAACPAGTYSFEGSGVCTLCQAGKWSDTAARSGPCIQNCTAGHQCPAGSSTETKCGPGFFSGSGASECSP
jgi:hypothetical protein